MNGQIKTKEIPKYIYSEVVRCKDCKHWERANVTGKGLICPVSGMDITPNDYCSRGEKNDRTLCGD